MPRGCAGSDCDAAREPDSRLSSTELLDAGPSDGGALALSADEAALSGSYAIRVRYFLSDLPARAFKFQHELVLRGEIHAARANPGLELDVELCRHQWQILPGDGTSKDSQIVHPDKWPRRTFALHYADGEFHTTGDPLAVGYDPVLPTECTAGDQIPKGPEQVWISGNLCDCPSSAGLPTSANDCRVVDTDDDRRAGLTVTTSGSPPFIAAIRDLDQSQFIAGRVHTDGRLSAQFFAADDLYVLACEPLTPGCLNLSVTSCQPDSQPVLFEPLQPAASGASLTCADILARYATKELFTSDPLIFPSGC
ncbi:MAG: hypothetical protein JWN48_2376 [Myxococcaceae bacterium]|nr:hypothetical protein [Myxococcaceae bacterium]